MSVVDAHGDGVTEVIRLRLSMPRVSPMQRAAVTSPRADVEPPGAPAPGQAVPRPAPRIAGARDLDLDR